MPRTAVTITISLPKDLFRAFELTRKKTGKTRSAAVQEALRQWLKRQRGAEVDRQYVEGYRRIPETREEIAEAEAMAKDSFAAEEW